MNGTLALQDMTGATVYWRFGEAGAGLPPVEAAEGWLAPPERERLGQLRVEKRRRDWVLGRLNLKSLLVDLVAERWGVRLEPRDLLIDRLPSGAPSVRLAAGAPGAGPLISGQRVPVSVSNSHSEGRALGAAMWTDGLQNAGWTSAVGADLERIEPRSPGFVADFLTAEERQFWNAGAGVDRDMRANLVWSAKEAVLKVLQRGLSVDTWWLTCLPDVEPGGRAREAAEMALPLSLLPASAGWLPFSTACDARLEAQHVQFAGRWCRMGDFVLTLAVGVARTLLIAPP